MKRGLRFRWAWAVLVFCLGSALAPAPAQADQPPDRLKVLTISIWLEYDRPGELYIYRGELPTGTALPARLSFRLPARSDGPSSTAGIDSAGQYRYIRPTLSEDGDTIIAGYEVNWPRFQLEYYDDALRRQNQSRHLDFVYRSDYAIEQLVLEVKEPHGASSFTLDPAGSAQSQGEDGLTVHRRVIGPVAHGQEVRWKVTYNKGDSRLAAEALGLPTAAPSVYEASAGVVPPPSTSEGFALAIFALLGLVAVGGLGFVLLSGSARPAGPAARPGQPEPKESRRRRRAKGSPAPPQVRLAKYCHQCGASLARGDQFCRRCGTPRRGA